MNRPRVQIYSDASIYPNPGEGAWAAIMCYNCWEREIASFVPGESTNIKLELTAMIGALTYLKQSCEVSVYSDLQLLVKGTNTWAGTWANQNWRTKGNKERPNSDLWKQILEYKKIHRIKAHWIRGHDGHEYNERVDRLAGEARINRCSFTQIRKVAEPLSKSG